MDLSANQTPNVRESFESCTTQGKKESIAPGMMSEDEPYGHLQNEQLQQENSLRSNHNSETIGENSLPDINNSVVEDSLPFKGLENHYKGISKEGFSGANDTNYMKKTNENFYSSFKSKRNDTPQYTYQDKSQSNGRVGPHEYNSSDLDIKTSSQQPAKTMQNNYIASRKKNNRSKQSNSIDNQTLLSYEIKGDLAKGNKSGKIFSKKVQALDSGRQIFEYQNLDLDKIDNDERYLNSKGKKNEVSYDEAYDHLKSFRNNKPSNDGFYNKGKAIVLRLV